MWSSVAVLIGLGAVALGYPWADSAAAVVVAVFICIAGWRLGRRTIDTLTDTAPTGVADKIRAIAHAHSRRGRDRARAGAAGGRRAVRRSRRGGEPHAAARPRRRHQGAHRRPPCASEFRNAETTVNIEPRALDDETVLERVMVIARNRALAVHHVTVHAIGGRLSVSLDLEVDGELSLARAHEIADGLEAAVRDELGPEVEVETHIEPLQMRGLAGRDAPAERVAAVQRGARGARREARLPCATCTTCACARPPTARSSISTAIVDPALTGRRRARQGRRSRARAALRASRRIKRVIGHAEPRRINRLMAFATRSADFEAHSRESYSADAGLAQDLAVAGGLRRDQLVELGRRLRHHHEALVVDRLRDVRQAQHARDVGCRPC